MFNSKAKTGFAEITSESTTIIGAGTTISGNIESKGDIRVDGVLIGNLHSGAKILIGPDGNVEGDLHGLHADILGKVTGKIKVEELLQLRDNANIKGDIYAGKLHIEPSVTFNGHCFMGANVVELNTELNNTLSQANQ
jgi:cytoskeletal protein CcmA (bactofilin family)